LDIYACETVIENEDDALAALAEAEQAGANAAVIYLGNFGPEGPLAIFAEEFPGPVMACAAAEETTAGLSSASYNFGLRDIPVYIPPQPTKLPEELVPDVAHFARVARVHLGISDLKVFSFGPRPHDFYACNAPIGPLYDIGIEVMENSELDLLQLFNAIDENDAEVQATIIEMTAELGTGNTYPDLLPKLARYEIALLRFAEQNLGSRQYGIFANKCWPAFEPAFGFVPCFVNSRLAARGIPVACEVDIYGAVSEYLCLLASDQPPTLLDINNTVPADMAATITDMKGASAADLFMGFHCGNTPSCCMKSCSMKYQLIMNRLMEDSDKEPDITRGTLEGQIMPGPISLFRLQGSADGELASYIAQGHVLDVDPQSFGSIGVFAIPEFARFYRHVMLERNFPHHGAIAFNHCGRVLFDALMLADLSDINVPLPKGKLYDTENPFA